MGACTVCHVIRKNLTLSEIGAAIDKLIADAICKYGLSAYNGTISTCQVGISDKIYDTFHDTEQEILDTTKKREATAARYEEEDGSIQWIIAGWAAE